MPTQQGRPGSRDPGRSCCVVATFSARCRTCLTLRSSFRSFSYRIRMNRGDRSATGPSTRTVTVHRDSVSHRGYQDESRKHLPGILSARERQEGGGALQWQLSTQSPCISALVDRTASGLGLGNWSWSPLCPAWSFRAILKPSPHLLVMGSAWKTRERALLGDQIVRAIRTFGGSYPVRVSRFDPTWGRIWRVPGTWAGQRFRLTSELPVRNSMSGHSLLWCPRPKRSTIVGESPRPLGVLRSRTSASRCPSRASRMACVASEQRGCFRSCFKGRHSRLGAICSIGMAHS